MYTGRHVKYPLFLSDFNMRITEQDTIQNVYWPSRHVKYPLFLSDFNEN